MSNKSIATSPGGSALVRGVMMSNGTRIAGAARNPDGEIVTKVFTDGRDAKPSRVPARIRKMPILRGLFGVGGGLGHSIDALRWSAVVQNSEAKVLESYTAKRMMTSMFVFFCGIFGFLPIAFAFWVSSKFDHGSLAFALGESFFSAALFLGYLGLISRLKHIREVFEYHGAEHKTVAAYEAGVFLTPETASRYSRFHPRCGTNYMALILVGAMLLAPIMVSFPLWIALPLRFLGLAFVAGLAYEVLKLAAKNMSGWGRFALMPGFAIQRLTTREPDLEQLEVAIEAFRLALSEDELLELDSRTALVAA